MGIRFKLFIPVFIGFSLFSLILITYWVPYYIEKEREIYVDNQNRILQSIMPVVTQSLIAGDMATLYAYLDKNMEINGDHWLALTLYNVQRKVIYPLHFEENAFKAEIINIKHNVMFGDEYLGQLKVVVDWTHEYEEVFVSMKFLTYTLLFTFLFIVLLQMFWQTIWVHRPIKLLRNAAVRLQDEDFDVLLPVKGGDEIAELGRSFDDMRNNLNSSRVAQKELLLDLQEKEQRYRSILDATPDAILTISDFGKIEMLNPSVEDLFEYKSYEIVDKPIFSLFTLESHDTLGKKLTHLSDNGKLDLSSVNEVLIGKAKYGREFPVELTGNRMILNDSMHYTLAVRDISERRKLEKLKDDFVSTVSHELRTPLTSIKGSLSLVAQGLQSKVNVDLGEMLEIAGRNTDRLLLLINDLLDLSKLESGKYEFHAELVSVMELIERSIVENQSYAESCNTNFLLKNAIERRICFNVDSNRLLQVMSNLLSNAAKYSPKDVPVEIYLSEHDGIIRVTIKDYGQGVPTEFRDKLFKKFSQADSGSTRKVSGTGLGLSICKKIIDISGGTIGYSSEDGQGSEFYFELPFIRGKNSSQKSA